MDLKDEVKSLDPFLRRRIRIVFVSCGVWTGVLLGTAAIFQLGTPWMDKRRLEKEASLEAKLEERKEDWRLEHEGASTANFGKQSGTSELLEAAYTEQVQVLNSTDGKDDSHEYFQKMFQVYGGVNVPSDFLLVSERVVALINYFEPQFCNFDYRHKVEYI